MNDEKKLPPGWGQQTSSQPVWNNTKDKTQPRILEASDTDTPKLDDPAQAHRVDDKQPQEKVGETFEIEESKAIAKETVEFEKTKKTVEEFAGVEETKELIKPIVEVEEKSQSNSQNQKRDKKQTGKSGNVIIIMLVVVIVLLLVIIALGICQKSGAFKDGFGKKFDDTTHVSETMTESNNKEDAKSDNNSQTEDNSETENNTETESNSEVQSNSETTSNSQTENDSQTENNAEVGNNPETDNDTSVENEVENEENTTQSGEDNPLGSIVYETSVDWSEYAGTWSDERAVHMHGDKVCYKAILYLELWDDDRISYELKQCNGISLHSISSEILHSDGDGTYSGYTQLEKIELGVYQGGVHMIVTNRYNIMNYGDIYLTMKID